MGLLPNSLDLVLLLLIHGMVYIIRIMLVGFNFTLKSYNKRPVLLTLSISTRNLALLGLVQLRDVAVVAMVSCAAINNQCCKLFLAGFEVS